MGTGSQYPGLSGLSGAGDDPGPLTSSWAPRFAGPQPTVVQSESQAWLGGGPLTAPGTRGPWGKSMGPRSASSSLPPRPAQVLPSGEVS